MTGNQARVDQMVFRWDADNRSGSTGFGLVAWSCEPERAEALCRGAAGRLQVAGGRTPPGLVRIGLKGREEVLLVRREPGHDPGGRPGTVCHALLGSSAGLSVETCLGLHPWTWDGNDISPHEVTGPLAPVSAGALLQAAMPRCEGLSAALARVAEPLSVAVAEVLRFPGSRYSFLDRSGGDFPYLVLWGLYGIFRGMRAPHPLGWSFATHDRDDSEAFRFVFVPQWPASASADERRVRTDLEQPRDDDAMKAASLLVGAHLEWLRYAEGRESPVPAALAEAGGGLDSWDAGDALLRAAERAVKELHRTVRPVGPTAPEHGQRRATAPPSPHEGGGRAPSVAERIRAAGDGSLLRGLDGASSYKIVDLVLNEIEYRIDGWPPALRRRLCETALHKDLFLTPRPSPGLASEAAYLAGEAMRAENAVWLYHRVVRPWARESAVRAELRRLLPELRACEDGASLAVARAILEEGELPGLEEDVWRAVLRADRERSETPRPSPGPAPAPERPDGERGGPGRFSVARRGQGPTTRTVLPGAEPRSSSSDREGRAMLVAAALLAMLIILVVWLAVWAFT